MPLSELDLSPWAVRAAALVWGLIWGSFINVVIYRVPRAMSVVRPGSHCPACGAPIRPLDNIPLLSWVLLRSRASCCGAKISSRYAVVELLAGAVAVAVAELVFRQSGNLSAVHGMALFLADFGLAMALVAAAFIDAEHMYLPDAITIGGTLFGLATPGLRDLSWGEAIAGAAAGFGGVWILFVVGYRALRGRAGMGLGDAKLLMLAGGWFGWQGAVFALFAGAVQATLAAAVVFIVRGKIEEPAAVRADREALVMAAAEGDAEAQKALLEDPLATAPQDGLLAARIPFGPFLCVAIIEWMLAGEWIRDTFPWL